ncbi:outer membrane protein [Martelella endophytica]|uniref:Membrane protein n=1 Tax=Martelella endophytica TaxID=1486262 RepID=A0A0D5LXS4_MAREN|nr:outer membrane protein [Martelella endophytica]AJY48258.1 membrane protein [Martelella endophytica]
MRNLNKTLTAATMLVLGAGAAQAADAIVSAPYEPSPVTYAAPVKVSNWSGFYLGGAANWDWGTFQKGDFDADGWGGTLFGGYNMQSGSIVYGVEADLATSNQHEYVDPNLKMEQGVNGSLRGRIGYAMDPVMVYGTGGLAGSKLQAKQGGDKDKQMAWGYTLGAGVEAMVTDNISARVEYRYTDYGDQDFNLNSGRYKRGFQENTVKVGLGVHF